MLQFDVILFVWTDEPLSCSKKKKKQNNKTEREGKLNVNCMSILERNDRLNVKKRTSDKIFRLNEFA